MELSKQDMELYLLLPDIQSKYFFYIMFLTLTNELQIFFKKQEVELFRQEMEVFLLLPELQSKTSFLIQNVSNFYI